MPIRGLTDRGADFVEIGRIRKGGKRPENGKKPGPDLTYFRVEFDQAERENAPQANRPYPRAETVFKSLYPAEPAELDIMLPLKRVVDVWDAWIEAFTAGGLVYRSNGNGPEEVAAGEQGVVFWRDPLTGATLVRNGVALVEFGLPGGIEIKPGERVPCIAKAGHPVGRYEGADGKLHDLRATPIGRLKVMLPRLQRFAYLLLPTTSQYDIANISAQIEGLELVQRTADLPGVAGIPLVMRRRPQMISIPIKDQATGNIKRQRMEKWLVSIEPDPRWAHAKALAMIEAATPDVIEGQFVELPELAAPFHPDEEGAAETGDGAEAGAETVQREATGAKPGASGKPVHTFSLKLLESLVQEGLAPTVPEAAKAMGRSPWAQDRPIKAADVKTWLRIYNGGIDEGKDAGAAAEAATRGLPDKGGTQ